MPDTNTTINDKLQAATRLLSDHPQILLAALFGSRARGDAKATSDRDIAVKWRPDTDWFLQLGEHERLRSELAGILGVTMADLDLVDLKGTSLALRAAVADERVPLADQDGLTWIHFCSAPGASWKNTTGTCAMRLEVYQAETEMRSEVRLVHMKCWL